MGQQVKDANGKLGILIPGLGAVATTLIAGVASINKGFSKPIGSVSQLSRIRLGKRTENRNPLIKDFVPLAKLEDVVFGGWDVYEDNVYEAASKAQVLEQGQLDAVKAELEAIQPMKAVFDRNFVKNLDGTHIKSEKTRRELADAVQRDIREFKEKNGLDRIVLVWCGSTERYIETNEAFSTLAKLEEALDNDDQRIPPSMIYCYAALKEGAPYVNGAPNLTCDVPAIVELAHENGVAIAGKDFKTGQTLMKTIVAPGLQARALGVEGWFSTNILGNRDGLVLDDPENFKTKEVSKLSVLEEILDAKKNPELYGDLYHKVRINYYPPHGDNKESWDNIDIFGWLGYKMQIKINFLCRDSILAAPVALDLALFIDLAQRAGMSGIQEWLSFYLKSPQTAPGLPPEHDIFKQLMKLQNTLRHIMGEDLITHLGLDYYQELVDSIQ
ncbi:MULTISPECIES: inositol-3-phosphate synthase [Sphingobacterium]|jgi:myo-inositol-1-phosphate synthase|uniref:Inositol-3-phosphate synthase n=2 Tax=Sphingobacterium TaxID=28453 RepID=A0ACD5C5Z6_9SPHI|nr:MULTISPECIES: inositol-3-phosphate synthase [Sphingobacterium]HAE69886.1 inositol-3-phosphate synthase [Sphingobacterium sp.]MDF2849505.1 inositol-3-phosphate synthase [Sphingobacterium multivorum]OFV10168.1 inositol-3-phosphate synthase [Sphingobacterium sp. HMSC13C05]OJZ07583.1 MAG: inositol-3-phosphate synthase [Sphingobacterium sp. 40-24]QQT45151.1 inositol-3-phosphate synthase [Sphingobacterium multivorum]